MRAYAEQVQGLGAGVEQVATSQYQARNRAASEWEGQASEAFQRWADQQGDDGDVLAQLFTKVADAVEMWCAEIDTVKSRMEQAKQVASDGQLAVLVDLIYPPKPLPLDPGGTSLPGANSSGTSAEAEAARARLAQQETAYAEAQATVKYARDLERSAHEMLVRALDAAKGDLKAIPQAEAWEQAGAHPSSPASAAVADAAMVMESRAAEATKGMFEQALQQGPAAVHVAWSSLSAAQRADLIGRFPQMVGNTDGVPAQDRHAANMTTLNQQRAGLLAKLRDAEQRARESYGNPNGMNDIALEEVKQAHEALKGLGRIETAATQDGKLLLGLDAGANGRGQVIIASGNPDTAQHVVTTVPGTYSDVGDAMDYVERGDRIIDRAKQFAPGETFASVTWVDYQSPGTLVNASEGRFAEDAKGDLSSFQEGLRATHEGRPSHNTVIGHSYGSTTVGYAARDNGLHSDDLVLIGSPGVGVDTAGELGVPPENVWSGTSGLDVIDYATPSPNPIDYLLEEPFDDHHWFGRNPSNEYFGARELPVNNWSGHGGYWDHPESVDGMAKVVANKTQPTDGVR
ncbi:alpha/beta hydrolase [Saccharopolyspora sp. NPDC002686]|uniref:alpha/beta hydrolase n=1 Tax=Saccharopolyspora sp. NPDC002686 TaxID=3154541 RepID=UPI00331A196A